MSAVLGITRLLAVLVYEQRKAMAVHDLMLMQAAQHGCSLAFDNIDHTDWVIVSLPSLRSPSLRARVCECVA